MCAYFLPAVVCTERILLKCLAKMRGHASINPGHTCTQEDRIQYRKKDTFHGTPGSNVESQTLPMFKVEINSWNSSSTWNLGRDSCVCIVEIHSTWRIGNVWSSTRNSNSISNSKSSLEQKWTWYSLECVAFLYCTSVKLFSARISPYSQVSKQHIQSSISPCLSATK